MVHLLRYIRDTKLLGLNYYASMKDAPLSDMLRQSNIKTENQLVVSLILVRKIVQTLAEVQEHILYFINMFQFTMAHMFQERFLNQVHKVSTLKNTL